MRTHKLETGEGGTCQDTERSQPTKVHSLPGNSRGRDLSGHRKKSIDRGALTSWRRSGRHLSGHGKKPTDRGTLTNWRQQRDLSLEGHRKKQIDRGTLTFWRRQREGLVRTRKETKQLRRTHILGIAEGETCQDTKRN